MASKKKITGGVRNRRARFDYHIEQTYLAGIVLSGAETKSLRAANASLSGTYVQFKNEELWLINALISPLVTNSRELTKDVQQRDRKLLLTKKEIKQLQDFKKQGYTIIPLKILANGRFIKIEIAAARGKKKYDKREALKKRDQERNIQRRI